MVNSFPFFTKHTRFQVNIFISTNFAHSPGVRIYEKCKVTKIVTRENSVEAVETSRGKIECEHFVNGAGFWARSVGRLSVPYVKVSVYIKNNAI